MWRAGLETQPTPCQSMFSNAMLSVPFSQWTCRIRNDCYGKIIFGTHRVNTQCHYHTVTLPSFMFSSSYRDGSEETSILLEFHGLTVNPAYPQRERGASKSRSLTSSQVLSKWLEMSYFPESSLLSLRRWHPKARCMTRQKRQLGEPADLQATCTSAHRFSPSHH